MDVDFAFWSLHRVDVGGIFDVSEVYALSISRIEMCRVNECLCIHVFQCNRPTGGRVGGGALSEPVGQPLLATTGHHTPTSRGSVG
jgi:hypothetical protein